MFVVDIKSICCGRLTFVKLSSTLLCILLYSLQNPWPYSLTGVGWRLSKFVDEFYSWEKEMDDSEQRRKNYSVPPSLLKNKQLIEALLKETNCENIVLGRKMTPEFFRKHIKSIKIKLAYLHQNIQLKKEAGKIMKKFPS